MTTNRTPLLIAAAAIAVLVLAPFGLDAYWIYVVSMWMVISISAIGLNIPMGLGSIYSFGHGAFMLVGAYGTAVAMINWDWPFLPAVLLSVAMAALIGAIIGLPSLRLSGFALAIVTFSFGFLMFNLVKASNYTGGPQGMFMPEVAIAGLWNGKGLYYLILAIAIAGLLGFLSLSTGKTGRALRTIGSSELVAQSLGMSLLKYKVLAFVLSAVYAAVSGSLLAVLTSYVRPESFSPELSVNIFAAVIIGGAGTLIGPLFGAMFIVLVPELTQSLQHVSQIVYAILFCLSVTLFPGGLVGIFKTLAQRQRGKTQPGAAS